MKKLSKADMQEFYKAYVSPSSSSRARISIHLHASGAGEVKTKVNELLARAGLEKVPSEKLQSLDILEKYLRGEYGLAEDKITSIIAEATECGLKAGASPDGSAISATEIIDIRRFKSGLLASPGARPVKDLSEYEDIDAKL